MSLNESRVSEHRRVRYLMLKAPSIFVCAACVSGALGQSFVQYNLTGKNLSGGGLEEAKVGDVIRISVFVNHDGLSYAGGKVDVLSFVPVRPEDVNIREDAFAFPFDPWEIGRSPNLRVAVSDGPPDAVQPRNEDIVAMSIGPMVTAKNGYRPVRLAISDANGDFLDFGSIPPGLGGLSGAFPIASGHPIFVFDWVYQGGTIRWQTSSDDTALLWRNAQDINGIEVPARDGGGILINPAPGTLSALVIAAITSRRRR
eukprot:TRINITY_DN12843_c2_g1_i1.p2 TRINITY_DN12843_c2_g1~~TRINITY_DN12843_c2_g1_i1.p2  ORF type:complete len:257 (+),score=20.25 TRINITY_DN12843_c2_g1_i1:392-1162(+)